MDPPPRAHNTPIIILTGLTPGSTPGTMPPFISFANVPNK